MSTTRVVKERDWTKEKKLAQDAGTATKECALLRQIAGTGMYKYSCAVSQSQAFLGVFHTQRLAASTGKWQQHRQVPGCLAIPDR